VAYSHFERLSAIDASFLEIEDENAPMHVGVVAIFDAAPLTSAEGGLDIERIRRLVESVLVPRYRQRIARVPITGDPVWVDDPHFNLHYHLRHLSLPHPGDERQLKRLAGHVMGLPLDHNKPLWELWVVEGLAERRFAIITKAHHCLMDGVGGAEVMTASLQAGPDASVKETPRWLPRPSPGPLDLLLGEALRRAGLSLVALRAVGGAAAHPRRAFASLREGLASVGQALSATFRPASPTPLNVQIGPHRRFDWIRFDLDAVKEVKNRLGGTVNDVVLATAAGALRRFLKARGEDVDHLDFRAMIPVNLRAAGDTSLGNRVSSMAARLPLEEPDPRKRLARTIEISSEIKASRQARGVEMLEEMGEWGLAPLFAQLTRMTTVTRPFNVVVTNVPGPQIQAYLLGAPLLDVYPLVPLYRNQALGIALFSYNGGLFWGFNADWDAVPDLHDLVVAVAADFEHLRKAAQA
jgi:diacylglycerol O-acyltransferase / wax synthase